MKIKNKVQKVPSSVPDMYVLVLMYFPAYFLLPLSNPDLGIEFIRNLCSINARSLNFVLLTSSAWDSSVQS